MKRFLVAWLVSTGLALTATANEDDSTTPTDDEEDVDREVRFTTKRLPRVEVPDREPRPKTAPSSDTRLSMQEYADRPYPPMTYHGAEALDLEPDFVYGVQQGLDLLFQRQYKGAREHFVALEEKFPGTAVAAVADTLVWQALMLENFDFRYDKQYQVSSKAAKDGLAAALKKPGAEAWEHVLMGGIVGIEAIHSMRKSQYLPALQLALSAMDHIGKAREAAPNFVDLALADGMYNYWRSAVTMGSKILPDFEDRRGEGIQQMQTVQDEGVFLSPMATLALAFTWLEENDLKRALNACVRNRKAYPDSIVNNLVTATTYLEMRRYNTALEVLDDVLRVDANNNRARYWRGVAHLKNGSPAEAADEFNKYLAAEHLEDYQRANAYFRLGQAYNRQKKHAEAFEAFRQAEKANGHKGAKTAIARMKERKKAGKINF